MTLIPGKVQTPHTPCFGVRALVGYLFSFFVVYFDEKVCASWVRMVITTARILGTTVRARLGRLIKSGSIFPVICTVVNTHLQTRPSTVLV